MILPAQDRVSYRIRSTAKPVTQIGAVLDYTGQELVFRPHNESTKRIPADLVEGIQTHYDPAYLSGLAAFRAGDTQLARTSLATALKNENREWVDRDIHAWLVKCALREDDLKQALFHFREIIRSDSETRHWGVAPLVWAPMNIGNDVKTQARQWLIGASRSDQLLAVSLLLDDVDMADTATRKLDDLARDTNPRISSLARAQQWRLKLNQGNISDVTLTSWARTVGRMLESLRGGPQYLVARGYRQRGEHRRASAEYLWIPYVYDHRPDLAARSILEAAESMERTGLTGEAHLLYRELVAQYTWASESRIASNKLSDNPN